MCGREYIRDDDKAASRLAPKGEDGGFDLYVAVNGRNDVAGIFKPVAKSREIPGGGCSKLQ